MHFIGLGVVKILIIIITMGSKVHGFYITVTTTICVAEKVQRFQFL